MLAASRKRKQPAVKTISSFAEVLKQNLQICFKFKEISGLVLERLLKTGNELIDWCLQPFLYVSTGIYSTTDCSPLQHTHCSFSFHFRTNDFLQKRVWGGEVVVRHF